MSFLFGKKNKGDKAANAPPTRDGAPSQASGTSIPTANGIRPRGPGGVSSPAPGGESGNTPTPEQTHDQRGGYEQENQVCVLHQTCYCISGFGLWTMSFHSALNNSFPLALLRTDDAHSMVHKEACKAVHRRELTQLLYTLGHKDDSPSRPPSRIHSLDMVPLSMRFRRKRVKST